MSKQQGQTPDENQVSGKAPRKRKGKYELWMRHNPKYNDRWAFGWHKVRTYSTMEMAEHNRKEHDRKWNQGFGYPETENDRWEFEVRVRDN